MLHIVLRSLVLSLLLLSHAQGQPAKEAPKPPVKAEELTLEKLFPKGGLFGPAAHGIAFSHDGKYAAYLHRTHKDRKNGADLWLLETAASKVTRVTSTA